MKRLCVVLFSILLFPGISSAERGDAMMAWPHLVQMDFDAFHGEIIKTCTAKYPQTAPALKAAIATWKSENIAAVLELRRRLQVRFMAINGLSEADAARQIEQRGKTVTEGYLRVISSFKEEAWNESCNGKYATETLQEMNFVSFLAEVTPYIPRLTPQFVFPTF